MSIPRFAVERPVTTTMIFAALAALGVLGILRIGQDLFPDVQVPQVGIITVNPGVGPFDIESGITRPIEAAVASIDGVQSISSVSRESASQVVIGFADGTDTDDAVIDIREALNAIEADLPEGTERSGIFPFSATQLPTLTMNIFTESSGIDIRALVSEEIVPQLERIPGVAAADVFGGRDRAVLVELSLSDLAKTGVPVTQVLNAFQGENTSLPGGRIAQENQNIVVRTVGEFRDLSDIENVLVGVTDGVPIYLRDLATVRLDFMPQDEFVRAEGAEGIRLQIQKQSGFNTVDVNDAVLERLEELREVLPPSLRMEIQTNQAESVRDAIGGVASAGWQGGLLAIVVLLFFLRNVRSTIIVSTAIPLAVIATMSLIDFGGMTLNITSLMGITLAIGMFVDNAIVVLESIYRKALAGYDRQTAAIEGAEEVSKAITASTLTSMAVFVPMLFVDGLAGALFEDLSLTISFSLAMSLITALAFIPMLSSRFLAVTPLDDGMQHTDFEVSLADVNVQTGRPWIDGVAAWVGRVLQRMDGAYEAALRWTLKHVTAVLVTAVGLLLVSVLSVLLLGMEFLPEADEGRFTVEFETRVGSTYSTTSATAVAIERIVRDVAGADLQSIAAAIGGSGGSGGGGSNVGEVQVALTEVQERNRDVFQIVREIDDRISAEVLDVEHSIQIEGMSNLAAQASGGGGGAIELQIRGSDLETMGEYADLLAAQISQVPGTRSVRTDYEPGTPELQFVVDRERATSFALSPREIATTVRTAYNGTTVSRFRADNEDEDVVVLLQDEDRNTLDRFRSLFFVNRAGSRIPIENVVDLETEQGPGQISRLDRSRMVRVVGDLDGQRPLNRVSADIEALLEDLGPPPVGIDLEIAGSTNEMVESFGSLIVALMLAAALVYMVMASQFEDFVNPLIVMASVPFAVIGLVGALLVTNTTFSILAFVGAILLVGIVVNNAIVLIDYTMLLRTRGLSLVDAIVKGGKTRLKPILMTSLTTILGLIPMALGLGPGAELRYPIGRAVVGGLTTSTLITLILIPALYFLVESRLKPAAARAANRLKNGSTGAEEAHSA